jgi:hypothetical protein
MHTVSQMDRNLYVRARRKQEELWDRIIAAVSGEWDRAWSRDWSVRPSVCSEDVMEDLEYGRD